MAEYLIVILLFLVLFLVFCFGFFVALLYNIGFAWLLPLLMGGAFFANTDEVSVRKMIMLAEVKPGDRAVDIGSGDGRLVIELAKAGAKAHGYEINPFLVMLSRRNIKKVGLHGKAFVYWKNFWNVNLSEYNTVVLFQIAFAMPRLEQKLKKELQPGTKIVSNYFVFPNLQPVNEDNKIRLYKIVEEVNGH